MKVTISVCGKFHAFYLAKELEKRGYLDKIFTSYPWLSVKNSGVSRQRVRCFCLAELLERAFYKVPYLGHRLGYKLDIQYYLDSLFERQVASCLEPCDIFLGWSGASLGLIRKMKSLGAVTIVERGSSHIEYQTEILKDEYARLGISQTSSDRHIVEKEKREYREADYISVPSTFAKKSFLERGVPCERIICNPLGVDTEVFKPVSKKDNIFRILYVGNMSLRKGIPYLLQAVSVLKLKDSETWLIGGMSDEIRPFLKEYSGNFRYIGQVNFKQLYQYYSQGSVFVLPSIEEGFGLVILQAMACGIPVICTTNTAGEDLVRNGIDGFVIPIRDVESLKEKITYFYEKPGLCKAMGESARERACNNFTWNHYGERITKTYLKILAKEGIAKLK